MGHPEGSSGGNGLYWSGAEEAGLGWRLILATVRTEAVAAARGARGTMRVRQLRLGSLRHLTALTKIPSSCLSACPLWHRGPLLPGYSEELARAL